MNVMAIYRAAWKAVESGDHATAEKILTDLIKTDSSIPEAWHNLGVLHRINKNYEKSSASLLNAARIYREINSKSKITYAVHDYISHETAELSARDIMKSKSISSDSYKNAYELFFKPYIENGAHVLEIGTGIGLISEFIINDFRLENYSSYEYDDELVDYLKRHFPSMTHMLCDGSTLSDTESGTVDAVIAYGVFTYISDYNRYSYFDEMARVAKVGGRIAFDIFDVDNFNQGTFDFIQKKQANKDGRPYLSGSFVKKYFSALGCSCIGDQYDSAMTASRFLAFVKS